MSWFSIFLRGLPLPRAFIHPFVHSFIHLFIHSSICSSFIHLFIHSFVHSLGTYQASNHVPGPILSAGNTRKIRAYLTPVLVGSSLLQKTDITNNNHTNKNIVTNCNKDYQEKAQSTMRIAAGLFSEGDRGRLL